MLSAGLWNCYESAIGLPAIYGSLDVHASMRGDQARMEMALRLQAQVRYFGARADALPEWKEAARIQDPLDLISVWSYLPILNRQDMNTRFSAVEIQKRFGIEGIVSQTGGSTGEPTGYLHDKKMLQASTAARSYCRIRAGWRPGMKTISIWGSDRDIGKANSLRNRISGRLRNEWVVGGYKLSQETTDRVVELIGQKQQVAIYGFSSMLEFVARDILERGIHIRSGAVAAAWNGGEMLYPRQSELFELAFGVPLLNLYGSRELSAMAYQNRLGQGLRVLRPLHYLEIVNDDNRPVGVGETGRLLWTSTVCRGTPLLRYECGDLGCYEAGGVDESGIREIAELRGRSAGLIEINGKIINGLFWNHLFKDYPEIEQFQVAVKSGRALELRLKGKTFSKDQEVRLRFLLNEITGSAPVSLRWVDQLIRSKQGKLEQVLREE